MYNPDYEIGLFHCSQREAEQRIRFSTYIKPRDPEADLDVDMAKALAGITSQEQFTAFFDFYCEESIKESRQPYRPDQVKNRVLNSFRHKIRQILAEDNDILANLSEVEQAEIKETWRLWINELSEQSGSDGGPIDTRISVRVSTSDDYL